MDVQANDLLFIIGEQSVRIRMLEAEIARLQQDAKAVPDNPEESEE